MMDAVSVTFPTLTEMRKTRSIPRRYEETRPVTIQAFAHRKILGLGNELHRRSLDQFEMERLHSIRKAEQAVWSEADIIKTAAVIKAQEEARKDNEKALKKLKTSHEKALKEEALRVEMVVQKLMLEQVQQERKEGDKRLREAMKETEQRGHAELLRAIEVARHDEKRIAATEAARIAKIEVDKLTRVMRKATEEREKALEAMMEAKDLERIKVVTTVRKEEQLSATRQLQQQSKEFDEKIQKLHLEIEMKCINIDNLLSQIEDAETIKRTLKGDLLETRREFQRFISKNGGFAEGQADFLLPSYYSDDEDVQ